MRIFDDVAPTDTIVSPPRSDRTESLAARRRCVRYARHVIALSAVLYYAYPLHACSMQRRGVGQRGGVLASVRGAGTACPTSPYEPHALWMDMDRPPEGVCASESPHLRIQLSLSLSLSLCFPSRAVCVRANYSRAKAASTRRELQRPRGTRLSRRERSRGFRRRAVARAQPDMPRYGLFNACPSKQSRVMKAGVRALDRPAPWLSSDEAHPGRAASHASCDVANRPRTTPAIKQWYYDCRSHHKPPFAGDQWPASPRLVCAGLHRWATIASAVACERERVATSSFRPARATRLGHLLDVCSTRLLFGRPSGGHSFVCALGACWAKLTNSERPTHTWAVCNILGHTPTSRPGRPTMLSLRRRRGVVTPYTSYETEVARIRTPLANPRSETRSRARDCLISPIHYQPPPPATLRRARARASGGIPSSSSGSLVGARPRFRRGDRSPRAVVAGGEAPRPRDPPTSQQLTRAQSEPVAVLAGLKRSQLILALQLRGHTAEELHQAGVPPVVPVRPCLWSKEMSSPFATWPPLPRGSGDGALDSYKEVVRITSIADQDTSECDSHSLRRLGGGAVAAPRRLDGVRGHARRRSRHLLDTYYPSSQKAMILSSLDKFLHVELDRDQTGLLIHGDGWAQFLNDLSKGNILEYAAAAAAVVYRHD
ncbi:hypothetical protein HU200_058927 [Digitaria exilis]|uniref:Uncharacterized protein n=1 Tax=Digitaria exilis TaxID=1010633 RepID=A0A835AB43_9POAL|nr:hypothetical protein HU200_058927 [Digitaria exilis]